MEKKKCKPFSLSLFTRIGSRQPQPGTSLRERGKKERQREKSAVHAELLPVKTNRK
jgi:hypothetical protein